MDLAVEFIGNLGWSELVDSEATFQCVEMVREEEVEATSMNYF